MQLNKFYDHINTSGLFRINKNVIHNNLINNNML